MKRNSWLLFVLMFASCLRDERKESKQLDMMMIGLQRSAMWHREYYFMVIKWKGKNQDSTDYYEKKMDSALMEYQKHMRAYDSLSKMYQEKSK